MIGVMCPEYGVQYYDVPKAPEPISSPAAHIYLSNLGEAEKAYYQFVTSGEKNFVDAAYEVAKNKQVIQVFTAGNRSMMAESFTRAMLPYFRPDAEKILGKRHGGKSVVKAIRMTQMTM